MSILTGFKTNNGHISKPRKCLSALLCISVHTRGHGLCTFARMCVRTCALASRDATGGRYQRARNHPVRQPEGVRLVPVARRGTPRGERSCPARPSGGPTLRCEDHQLAKDLLCGVCVAGLQSNPSEQESLWQCAAGDWHEVAKGPGKGQLDWKSWKVWISRCHKFNSFLALYHLHH